MSDEPDSCCFCGSIYGALIKLHQGWYCTNCLKKLIEPSVNIKTIKERLDEQEEKLREIESDLPLMKRLIPDYEKIRRIEAGKLDV